MTTESSDFEAPIEPINFQGEELGVVIPFHPWRKTANKWIIAFSVAAATRATGYLHDDLEFRGDLPEPFDIPNHIANPAVTFVLAERFANGYWGKEPEGSTPEEYKRQRKTYAIALGGFTVAANAVAEVVGYGSTSTPDVLDFTYGLLGGFFAYKAKDPKYIPPEVVQTSLATDPSGNWFRRIVETGITRRQEKEQKILAARKPNSQAVAPTAKPQDKRALPETHKQKVSQNNKRQLKAEKRLRNQSRKK